SLRQQNIDLAQLRDDLFGLMLLLGHSNVLSNGSIAYFREDHFSGGRPNLVPSTRSAIMSPIGRAEVAAGEGALHTWSIRSVSSIRKSCCMLPSRIIACARIPGSIGVRSSSSSE